MAVKTPTPLAALTALVNVAKKARKRLAGTNIMGQKLDKPLVDEINAAIEGAERAIDEEEQRCMKDERNRAQLRELGAEKRSRKVNDAAPAARSA